MDYNSPTRTGLEKRCRAFPKTGIPTRRGVRKDKTEEYDKFRPIICVLNLCKAQMDSLPPVMCLKGVLSICKIMFYRLYLVSEVKMRVRTLDSNWDWSFGKSRQCYASGSLATAYDVKQKILSWYNDCYFDMLAGIDYKNLLGKKGGKAEIDASIQKIIAVQPDIIELTHFESSVDNRTYSAIIRFRTVYNETIEVTI